MTSALKQRAVRYGVSQFGRPRGPLGRLAGWVMAHRSSNVQRSRWVVSLLDVRPGDRVVELGCGPGIAIRELSRLASRGTVIGIDHSEVMVRQATKRNAAAVRAGQVELRLGSADALPAIEGQVDTILAVNSMGFWRDPVATLCELRAKLRPDGTIAIASQPRCAGATAETSARAADDIEATLARAGFSQLRVETLDLDPPAVCVIGAPRADRVR
jgi:SAM-dependent methyltransferase